MLNYPVRKKGEGKIQAGQEEILHQNITYKQISKILTSFLKFIVATKLVTVALHDNMTRPNANLQS